LAQEFERQQKKWTLKSQRIKQVVTSFENFIKKHGAAGLYVFMSIPLMVDTLPLYLFSMLNAEENGKRALSKKKFLLINILAGATRGTIRHYSKCTEPDSHEMLYTNNSETRDN
jgi:hypothetical protein